MKKHSVKGGDCQEISVLEAGNSAGRAILFIHGFSQAAQVWQHQLSGPLARDFRLLAMDLRGHGCSSKPAEASQYTDGHLWADDVMAVCNQLALGPTLLVGWSYGGLVICDTLRKYGSSGFAGLVFCGAVSQVGSDDATAMLGPKLLELLPEVFSTDADMSTATLSRMIQNCYREPLADEDLYRALGYSVVTSPATRLALFSRSINNDDVLSAIAIPTLAIHGSQDQIVLQASSQYIVSKVPGARLEVLEGASHCSFADQPVRFNNILADFANSVFDRSLDLVKETA